MAPGTYLEKRRLMAGYSLSSLARELLLVTGFGTSRADSDFRRLRLTLISAEQGSLHHSPDRIDLIRNFVALDPAVYFRLIALEEMGAPAYAPGICRNCACSFHDPCTVPVETIAGLGTSTCCWVLPNVCSACTGVIERAGAEPPRQRTLVEQLRDLGERMARLNQTGSAAEQPALRLVPTTGEQ